MAWTCRPLSALRRRRCWSRPARACRSRSSSGRQLPPTPPLTFRKSVGLVTFMRFPCEARVSGAEIVWLPDKTLTMHSSPASSSWTDSVSVCPAEAAIV